MFDRPFLNKLLLPHEIIYYYYYYYCFVMLLLLLFYNRVDHREVNACFACAGGLQFNSDQI